MSEKNIVETVNVKRESDINGDKWMMEQIRSGPCTVTLESMLFQCIKTNNSVCYSIE